MITAAVASCFVLGSCLEPAEPTPVSTLISIDPVSQFTRGFESGTISRFEINLRFQNAAARTIYLDGNFTRIEKLVNQKWELARESPAASFQAFRAIPPGQRATVSFVVLYNRATSAEYALLERVRGLYRLRLRLAFNSDGSDTLAAEDSYSRPFAVTE